MSGASVELWVNGDRVRARVSGGEFLAEFLREGLGLVGTKVGCGVGVCGLCTVWMDGRLVSSCLVPAVVAAGRQVWTVEGLVALAEGRVADPPPGLPPGRLVRVVQRAFVECEGLQCGICTPGQLWAACALLQEEPDPPEERLGEFLAGNLCRCTGYQGILRAVRAASREGRLAGG